MTARPVCDDRGFMYVEVLISMVLMSMALLSIAPLFVMAGRENAAARDLTFAATVAQDRAERLKRLPYRALSNGQDEVTMRSMTYDRSWVVTNNTPHPGMRTVTVTVVPRRGTSTHGRNRVVSLQFYRVPQ